MHKLKIFFGVAISILAFAAVANAGQKPGDALLIAADNCFAVGQSMAADRGVALVAAQEAVQNGKKVCKIVVLAPATNGDRPKREIVFIPQ